MTTHDAPKPAGTPTWLDLVTDDTEAARGFYNAVFGWEYDIGPAEYGGYTTARIGERAVAGIAGPPPDAPAMPAAWGIYFASDAIETDAAAAAKHGAAPTYAPMVVAPFGSMAGFVDPTGASFNFWQADQHIGTRLNNVPGTTAWYELYTPDAKQARDFYSELLGATADAMPGGLEYYVLKHGAAQLAGIMQIDPSWGPTPAMWVPYFGVANADETVAKVLEHGGQIMGGIDDSPFGRLAALRDPAGAAFKIVEVPSGE